MDVFSLILGIAGLVYGGYKTYKSLKNDEKQIDIAQDSLDLSNFTANNNYELAKETYEYQKQLNDKVMEREDTAYQRQVADLQAAGLSPLMIGNGANATPLTTGATPQFDMSGINIAMGNMLSAYNDVFNRKLNKAQFRVQSALNMSNMYTQLAESKLNRDYIKLQNDYLDEKMKWEKTHGFRDLDWRSELLNAMETVINSKNKNSVGDFVDRFISSGKENVEDSVDEIKEFLNPEESPSPVQYGIINPASKYGHTLDNENYDNSRSTGKLLKEETIEKYYKSQIKNAIRSDNRYDDLLTKLYKVDDYLKKHISLENWKKSSESFILYYLKNGNFEGHKKYFD